MIRTILFFLAGAIFLLFQNCSNSKLVIPTGQVVQEAEADAIEILNQPADKTVLANSDVQFEVELNNTEGLTYQWYLGDQAIPGETGSRLSLGQVKLTDIGDYYVVVYKDGEPILTSLPGKLIVEAPIIGNLSLAAGIGDTSVGDGVTLAECPAGTQLLSNISVQNIPSVDNNEGAPGFIDYALCEKDAVLTDSVRLSIDRCAAGGVAIAEVTYKNVSTQDEGRDAPDSVTLSICDMSGAIPANVAELRLDACPVAGDLNGSLDFRNIGTAEGGNPGAPDNVEIFFCAKQ